MALDGKILAKAKDELYEKRRLKEERYDARLQKVYISAPRIRALDAAIRETMAELVAVALGTAHFEDAEDVKLRNLELQEQRSSALQKAGFADRFLDDEPMCGLCGDAGYVGTSICKCLMEIYKAKLRESLSSLLKLGDETFDSFELSYYDDDPSSDTGISVRRAMEIIYETCVEYARKFGKKSMNLFFNGAPGLGKTFLSACIARVVAENGYSVVYDMASPLFSTFADAKFGTGDTESAKNQVKRYLECDLLIIDDLGTEMCNNFVISALYEIINTRLVTGKKTIVSSNLTLAELRRQYSEQIMSRLEGEYQVLTFRGDDIRKKRNVV
ncbi:MAG: ATP-binding protein [Oscillospiraceae bacterium]|nr:ATP-binding protein [Oscillospiraceae bacterium]